MAEAPAPAGAYRSAVVGGAQVVTAGMTPKVDGVLVERGVVGADLPVARARQLAGVAAARAVAAVRAALDDAEVGVAPLLLTVYVRCDAAFEEHTEVADGASEVVADAFGSLPARAAVGVVSLPGGAPVEVTLVVGVAAP